MAITVPSSGAYVTGDDVGTIEITKPSGVADDDILLIHFMSDGSSETHTTSETGWTSIFGNISDGSMTHSVWWKRVTSAAGEPASFTFNCTSSNEDLAGRCWRIDGAEFTAPIGNTSSNTGSSATTTATGISYTANSVVFAFHGNDRDRGTPTHTGDFANDEGGGVTPSGNGGVGYASAYEIFVGSGTTSDQTWTISTADGFVCFQVEILEEGAGPSETILDYERGTGRGVSRGVGVGVG